MNETHGISREVLDFHHDSLIVDLHVDAFMWSSWVGYDFLRRHRHLPFGTLLSHVDLPRMEESGLDVVGLGVVCLPMAGEERRLQAALHQVSRFQNTIRDSGNRFIAVEGSEHLSVEGLRGRKAGFMGLEGAHCLGGDMEKLPVFHRLGVHYITLTHFSSNRFATCAKGRGADPNRGLTPLGEELVDRMNEQGLAVDLAHCNKKTFMQAVKRSKRPVFVSHTGVCGVFDLWRNIDDEQLRAVADSGGTVGIIFVPAFLAGRSFIDIEPVLDHIDYVVNTVGEDHVSIGSDWEGSGLILPKGLRDCLGLPNLTEGLMRRGHAPETVRKILGGNAARVFKEACFGNGMENG